MGPEPAILPAAPKVAVCVPARGHPRDLEQLLSALARQDWEIGRLRVVVALDGPDPRLRAVVERSGFEAVELSEHGGSYAARNLALDRLGDEPEVVLFTDSDCIPAPGWVKAHVVALRNADLSGGAVRVTVRRPASPAEVVDRARHLRQEEYVKEHGYAATANLGVRREVADLRFSARLRTGGDAEFCRRAVGSGFKLVYTSNAIVEHPARQTTRALFTKVFRLCRGVLARRRDYAGHWIPRPKPRLLLATAARREGISRGRLWEVQVVAIDMAASSALSLTVALARAWAELGSCIRRFDPSPRQR